MIELTGVTLQRAGRLLFDDFSLSLPDAGLYLVSGPAGSGKSLLARLLCGELRPQRGRVAVDSVDIYSLFVLNRPALQRLDALEPVPGGISISEYCRAMLFESGGDYREFDRNLPLIEQALRVRGGDFTDELSSGQFAGLQVVLAALLPLRCIVLDGQFNLLDSASAETCLGLFHELQGGASAFVIALASHFPAAAGAALASLQLEDSLPVRIVGEAASAPAVAEPGALRGGGTILRLMLAGGREPGRAYLSGRHYRILGVLERGLRIEVLGSLAEALGEMEGSGLALSSVEWEP